MKSVFRGLPAGGAEGDQCSVFSVQGPKDQDNKHVHHPFVRPGGLTRDTEHTEKGACSKPALEVKA